ncbi:MULTISPECIES: RBBP9/YdeN family alpha/beta hydrolase [Acinetobacter]|uniref:RBBP9/YdeN family alpha/beta hydrolase n=1 Tax=Acinetobacter TaxID=469 RepID=UPI0011166FDE|nr:MULTISPECIES: alpha/beta hydrolase [Acinetobacter]MBJ8445430.1 serine hydrolase family protein [Acinetobacter bereziniae]MBJ8453202.1 serine hydrolase family protein [Acinetobacter bereziniae]MBJ8457302.1 serine hydrolase family protein [Acinetobacter bereziniae]MBJ8551254.1 serine hydrolase family protein [Acinetobacter bereziniae]MBJ9373634.1 serine hydrolase family protein [Acinetobacter sp. TGL-Y2]
MKRVLIVHGYHASSEDHWYPWLKLQILATGNECEIVQLEQADHPQYEVWKHNLVQQIKTLNEDVIIVAHGLGCVASLAFLSSELLGRKLGALFLVAGFNQNLPTLPELNLFLNSARIDDALLRLNIVHRFIFFSNNDPFVPAPFSIQLGHLLNTQMIEVKGAGHFMATDGFNTLTILWEKLVILLNSEP